MTNLDVMLIESRPGVAGRTAQALEEAGCRVHRCHEPGEPSFPCAALVDPGSCPIDGHVDVALLVRPRIAPRPSAIEDGAICAIRAGIPVVEQGTDVLDPFAPWLTLRTHRDGDALAACVKAVEFADAPLRREILQRTARLFEAAGISPVDVTVRTVRVGTGLEIHLDLPAPATRGLQHALAVRALDAVRAMRDRTVGRTDVHVHDP